MCNECVKERINVFSAGAFKESVSDRGKRRPVSFIVLFLSGRQPHSNAKAIYHGLILMLPSGTNVA